MADPKKSRFPLLKAFTARFGSGQATLAAIDEADSQYGTQAFNGFGANSLQGSGFQISRARAVIYSKWQSMLSDPVVSSAMRLHCTAALGGHETTGDIVFIEKTADAEEDEQLGEIVEEIRDDLAPLLNRMAFPVTFNAACYGDGYARIYPKKGKGVVKAYYDEMVMPSLVQAYEKCGDTEGFVVYVGKKLKERLTTAQMVRMRMPRTMYEPQPLAVEQAWRVQIAEDDVDKIKLMPALAGGSFLQGVEEAYDRYIASLIALVGTRSKGSIDTAWLKVNVKGMTKDQQKALLDSVKNAQNYEKALQRQAIATKNPILESIRFLLPVSDDKQITSIESTANPTPTNGYSVDDVMFHAKLLAGALGSDMSMLGFSELLSGGMGDGGFFRMSAQTAERSRVLRIALDEAFNHIIEIHLLYKRGIAFPKNKRPWKVNFYGTISALESERQKTRQAATESLSSLAGALAQLKDIGLDRKSLEYLIGTVGGLDEDASKMIAAALFKAAQAADRDGVRPPRVPAPEPEEEIEAA